MSEDCDDGSIQNSETAAALETANQLQRLAWADRRPSSVPLIVFGSLVVLYGALQDGYGFSPGFLYWLIAGPAGFLICAAWYRRRQEVTGVGPGRGSYLKTGAVLFVAFAFVIPLSIVAMPTIGLALFIIAVLQRNTYLAVCAVFFGVLGFLSSIFTFDNLLYRLAYHLGYFRASYGYFTGASTIVYVVWGVLMVVAGLIALKREVSIGDV